MSGRSRFALDLVDGLEQLSVNAASKRVGEQLGIVPDSLRNWMQQARIDAGTRPGLTTDERAGLLQLEREVRELRRANAILKSASLDSTGQRNTLDDLQGGGAWRRSAGLGCRRTAAAGVGDVQGRGLAQRDLAPVGRDHGTLNTF